MFTVPMGITAIEPKSQAQFLSPDHFRNVDSVRIALTIEVVGLPTRPRTILFTHSSAKVLLSSAHPLYQATTSPPRSCSWEYDCLAIFRLFVSSLFPFFPLTGACTSVRWFEQCATLSAGHTLPPQLSVCVAPCTRIELCVVRDRL